MSTTFTPDQAAAQQFLAELRTRISTQPLPYQHGVEARALESMWEVFGQAREAMKKTPGCQHFADRTTEVLNLVVRPLTAKWHRAFEEGRLNGRDGADEFRGELQEVQAKLREFAAELHEMGYETRHMDALTPDVMQPADLDVLFKPLAFGIPPTGSMAVRVNPSVGAKEGEQGYYGLGAEGINTPEAEEVKKRRKAMGGSASAGKDAVGLAFSGGGIRSATFCLGVTQVLARLGLMREVDFLSTVSGGGYTGSFLSRQIGESKDWRTVAAPHGPDTQPIQQLRQRAKYLTARDLLDAWGMVTATVAGLVMNWTVPMLVLIVLAALTVRVQGLERGAEFWKWPVGLGAGLSLLAGLGYFGLLRAGSLWAKRAGWFLAGVTAGWLAALAAWGLALAYGFLFPHEGIRGWPDFQAVVKSLLQSALWSKSSLGGLSLGAVAALVPVVLRYVPFLKQPKVRMAATKVALVVAGAFVPVLGIVVFLLLYAVGRVQAIGWLPVIGAVSGLQVLWMFGLVLFLPAIMFLNINLTGPHRLYRNCLSKAFVERDEKTDVVFPLQDLNLGSAAPYHLLNAAVNLPSSQTLALRERQCDFFLFSKHWSGSPAVGQWLPERL